MREAKRNGRPATNRVKSTSTKKKISRVRRKNVGCAQKTSAVLTRVLFLLHTGIALWRVSLLYDAFYLYFLSIGVGCLLLEMVFTITVRQGKEYKWFCPSVFFYLLSVVPCLWLLELHQLDLHLSSPLIEGGCVETKLPNVTGQPAPPAVFTELSTNETPTFDIAANSRLRRSLSLQVAMAKGHVRVKRQSLSNSVRDNASLANRTITNRQRGRNSMKKNRKKKRKSKKRKRMRGSTDTSTVSGGFLLSSPSLKLRAAPDIPIPTATTIPGVTNSNATETTTAEKTTTTTFVSTTPTIATPTILISSAIDIMPNTTTQPASTATSTATTTDTTAAITVQTTTATVSQSLQTTATTETSSLTKIEAGSTTTKPLATTLTAVTPTQTNATSQTVETTATVKATTASTTTPTTTSSTVTPTTLTTKVTTASTTSRTLLSPTGKVVNNTSEQKGHVGSVPPQTTSAAEGVDDVTAPTHRSSTFTVPPSDSSAKMSMTPKGRSHETKKATPPSTQSAGQSRVTTQPPNAHSSTLTSSASSDVTTTTNSGATGDAGTDDRGGIDEIGSHITEFGSNAIKYIENTSQTVNNFLNQLDPQNWLLALHQVLLFVLVIGRWLLPKGEITRDQLSQLLLVFIGVGADILEFVSETIDDDVIAVRCDPLLHYIIYAVWSWSLLQFTLVLTAAKSRKTRVGFDGEDHVTMVSNRNSCCARSVFNNADLWGILVTMLLQDVPFLAFRLYMMIVYKQVHQMMVFFTGKNVLVVILQIYRLIVLQVERKDETNDTATDAELQPLKGTLKRLASQARTEGSVPPGDVKNASFKSRSDGSVVVKIHLESDATLKRKRGETF